VSKFVFLAHGGMDHTPDFQEAHMKWWSSIQDCVVDPGNPLSNGQNVTVDGAVTEITAEMDPPLGYMIVEAASMDDALDLLTDSPMGMRVYEAIPM